jgi:CubicO group peptidase (beta-lactamase class C family)
MLRKLSAAALVALVALTQTAAPVFAASPKQTPPPAEVRAKIDRAGLGEKARVTVWLRDGRKIKGYVAERRDAEFVVRDRKTDAPTIVPYADVTKADINRGHSTARNTAIGVAIGAGAVLTTLAILIASLDD